MALITCEEQSVWPGFSQSCQESQFRHSYILGFVDHGKFVRPFACFLHFLSYLCEEAGVSQEILSVKLGANPFVGRDALRREKERGPAVTTVGLVLDILALEKVYAQYDMPLHLPYASWTGLA